jgi:glucosamine-6-phosphate deaminase
VLVLVYPDAGLLAQRAADMVAALIERKPDAALGLAAGATPMAMYDELVRRRVDFSRITAFGLDDYLEIPDTHPASCARALRERLIDRVDLAADRVHLLGDTPDGALLDRCAAHEQAIVTAGGLDLQILGIGVNGHIGFNEPGASLDGRTAPVALTEATRRTNAPLFRPDGQVPRTAVTMGVGTILSARRIMLLATGPAKAEAVAKAVEGPVTAQVPASALQMHADAVMLMDEDAASRLTRRFDYAVMAQSLLGLPGMKAFYGLK